MIEIPTEYERLLDRDWREAAVEGGRFSLKSHTVARILLIRASQEKTRVGCFREYQNSIAESSHQLLADLIKAYNLTDFRVTDKYIENTRNGSDFLFKGLHNNEQSIKSTEGIDVAWVEEAQTISTNSIEVLTPTVRKKGSQLIYTYNRLTAEDPVHVRLVIEGRPNVLHIHTDYNVALKYGWMPDEIKNEMEDDRKHRPDLYRHKWLGEPIEHLESRIYKDWAKIDEVPHEARLERYGLDFGWNPDPSALVAIYSYNGGYIIDEINEQLEWKNRDIANTLDELEKALVVSDNNEPKSISEIKSYGVNIIPTVKGSDSKRHGIKVMQDQKISVTKRSTNVLNGYYSWLWKTDKDGNMVPGETEHEPDTLAAARYAITSLAPIKRRREMIKNVQYRRTKNKNRSNIGV